MSGTTRVGGAGANGNDLRDPDYAAGVIARVDSQLQEVRTEQAYHRRLLEKICLALSIEPDKSDPPPPFRKELESLQEKDAEITGQVKALTAEQAQTKLVVEKTQLDVRFGLIKGMPQFVKVAGMIGGGLMALSASIWAVLKFVESMFGKVP